MKKTISLKYMQFESQKVQEKQKQSTKISKLDENYKPTNLRNPTNSK